MVHFRDPLRADGPCETWHRRRELGETGHANSSDCPAGSLNRGLELILCDGSPGIGCPVIASLTGASFALFVVEPTVSGVHDFRRVAQLAARWACRGCWW